MLPLRRSLRGRVMEDTTLPAATGGACAQLASGERPVRAVWGGAPAAPSGAPVRAASQEQQRMHCMCTRQHDCSVARGAGPSEGLPARARADRLAGRQPASPARPAPCDSPAACLPLAYLPRSPTLRASKHVRLMSACVGGRRPSFALRGFASGALGAGRGCLGR